LELETKKFEKITPGTGYFGGATWSPNGRYIGILGHEREYENATLMKIWVYDTEQKELSCLTAESDLLIGDFAIGDFHQEPFHQGYSGLKIMKVFIFWHLIM
ncbi:S9 family peptidase, partial [Robertmurraya sp. DFI.2.37]|nr:S9 family peptidase [Robertmurraya sp. DFI.2.37]